jgi:hypothetical protein
MWMRPTKSFRRYIGRDLELPPVGSGSRGISQNFIFDKGVTKRRLVREVDRSIYRRFS